MKVAVGIEGFQPPGRPVCVALGTFDGLHRGHRAVVARLREVTTKAAGVAVVTTFAPHPLAVIAPPPHPFLLTTLEERLALFEAVGLDIAVVVRFDERLRTLGASDWLETIAAGLGARHVVVSGNHTFGFNRQGTVEFLRAWADSRGITVAIVPPVAEAGQVISSSAIRRCLRDGDVRQAAISLGRWYAVSGTVIPGEGRGKRLGIPTANLEVPAEKLVPARGVYAAYASVEGRAYPAAVNIGVRPTFGDDRPAVEAHLIGCDASLYGAALTLGFVERLRDERKFAGVPALLEQVRSDIERVADLLKTRPGEHELG